MTATPDHKSRAHAKLSPSSATRWMNCPGSIEAQEGLPDVPSEYAAEGTAAHELADKCLQHGFNADRFLGDAITADGFTFEVDPEMADHVSTYLGVIRQDYRPGDDLAFERQYPLDPFLPGQFGTSDAVNYRRSELLLRVYDLKYGQGIPVEVSDNWQLTCYGVGALMAERRPVREVELVIVQPRAPHADGPVRRWRLSAVEMMERAARLQEAGALALSPGAPRKAGPWCKFCKAAEGPLVAAAGRQICPTLTNYALAEAQMVFADQGVITQPPYPGAMSPAQIGHLLHAVPVITQWAKELQEYAFAQVAGGSSIPGWGLVPKRGRRAWTDKAAAEEAMRKHGLEDDDLYPRSDLISPAQAEKKLGRTKYRDVAEHVEMFSTGSTLAPVAGEPRPVVQENTHGFTDWSSVFSASPLADLEK